MELTQVAQRVLDFAREEAQRLNHNYIGTEHLLLGLLRDEEGVAARVLRRLGVELDETRAAVEHVIGRGDRVVMGEIGLTPRAKRVVDEARAAAQAEARSAVGPEHLLVGLLTGVEPASPGRGVAAGILGGFGVTLEQVRVELAGALAEAAPDDDQAWRRHIGPGGLPVTDEDWGRFTGALAQWRERRRQGRRYSLVLPNDLFEEVERLASRQSTTVVELLRRFTRLGLLATRTQDRPGASLVIREGGAEREILLL
jgi:hypothetical protein